MAQAINDRTAARVAFTYPDFGFYQAARLLTVLAAEMQSVAVGWQVYEITRRPLDLGLVGLAQFLPGILLFLISGHTADRLDRRRILLFCFGGYALCSALLLNITLRGAHSVLPIYIVLVGVGVVRSFNGPAGQSLVPQLVAEKHFPNAVAWGATVFQAGTILGPALGGIIYGFSRGPAAVYASSMIASLAAILFIARVKARRPARVHKDVSISTLLAGFNYIWREKLVLGSISLDLFAVLLGGAVALLPVYAREILKTGPWGLGLLRSAPGVGAAVTALAVAHWPLRRRAGTAMLWCVAGFGIFTIIFGLSHSLAVSMIALLFVGATDMVSVIVRGTLVQLATPDEMRGRVSAVNMLFIGASNEFGQFESGLTANWFGTVPAVIFGGLGTLAVVALWAWRFPELRRADQLTRAGIRAGS
jgi:MFS family permease